MIRYRPVVDSTATEIVAAEAIVSWPQPELASLSATALASLVETSGLTTTFQVGLLERVCVDVSQWQLWNPQGGELFYRSGNRMMAVAVDTDSGFTAGASQMLFEGPYLLTAASFPYYDVSPNGQRFLMLEPVVSQTGATQINVILNWFEELKRLVPTN